MSVFDLWAELSEFYGKIFNRVTKCACHVSKVALWGKSDEINFYCLYFFGTLIEQFFNLDKNNGQECQNANLYLKKKSFGRNFPAQMFFLPSSDLSRETCKEKILAGLSKIPSTCSDEHFQRNISEKNVFFQCLWNPNEIFVIEAKKNSSGLSIDCNKSPEEQRREKTFSKEIILLSISFKSLSELFFSLLAEKVTGIVQGNNFRNFITFSGSKKNRMKVFGLRMESTVFWQKLFLRVAKGAFQVSSSTLWEKMIKVNFTTCGLFRILFVLKLWQKNQSGLTNPQTKCTEEKNREKKFLSRMLFWTISDFEQSKLEFYQKLLQRLRKLHSMCPVEQFQSQILEKYLRNFQPFRINDEVFVAISNFFSRFPRLQYFSRGSNEEKRKKIWKIAQGFKFLRILSWKNRILVEQLHLALLQLQLARPEKYLEKKWFSFRKRFLVIVFRVSVISLSFCKIH